MPTFYSHARQSEDGAKAGTKQVFEHTFGVLENAFRHLHLEVDFQLPPAMTFRDFLKHVVLLHDLGKYTSFFQDYLLGKPHDQVLKQHARFGAQVIWNLFGEEEEFAFIGYFLIKNHHRNLHKPDAEMADRILDKSGYSDVLAVFERQKEDVSGHLPQIERELGLPDLLPLLNLPERKQFFRFVKSWTIERPSIQRYFFINYFFSLLIEGDKLDASGTPALLKSHPESGAVQIFLDQKKAADNAHNRLRSAVRREVIGRLQEPDITERKLFMLTAPTGIGKTLTALDFAVGLRSKLPNGPRIITGLPFVNIIEQTIEEYKKVFAGSPVKILGHYQYADVFGANADESGEDDSEKDYSRKRMELETWQADIIVTSFVQLLQTIIANKNKILLKFNHLAGAIVIMDEVQSLRLEQVPLVGAVLHLMSRFLDTRFILMTATKPLIFELAEREVFQYFMPGESITVTPLLKDPERIFREFHRTRLVPLMQPRLSESQDFLGVFGEKWIPEKSCLIVCNTVNRSLELFDLLRNFVREKGHDNPLFYLSTNVLPAHRMSLIQEIKGHIENGQKPILVSTQVVEAGVDLDFDMGFRDLGPVDSIVQVAGRINRENAPQRRYSPLYIVDFGDCQKIYGTLTDTQSRLAIGDQPILEPDYFKLVEQYFIRISDPQKSAYGYSRKVFNGLLQLNYDGEKTEDSIPVKDFRVIEESPRAISVFVAWDEGAVKAKDAYVEMINAPDRSASFSLKEDFEKRFKQVFHRHIIAVPIYYADPLPVIDPAHPDIKIKLVAYDDRHQWYLPPTGFIRKKAQSSQTISL